MTENINQPNVTACVMHVPLQCIILISKWGDASIESFSNQSFCNVNKCICLTLLNVTYITDVLVSRLLFEVTLACEMSVYMKGTNDIMLVTYTMTGILTDLYMYRD